MRQTRPPISCQLHRVGGGPSNGRAFQNAGNKTEGRARINPHSPCAPYSTSMYRMADKPLSGMFRWGGGAELKSDDNPMQRAHQSPRCTAHAKRSGILCKNPAVRGWSVCRMHGAGGGHKRGSKQRIHPLLQNPNFLTGYDTEVV